jgi:hypothetical protein
MRNIPFAKAVKWGAAIVLFLAIIIFSYFKTRDIFFGARFAIEGIANNAVYDDPVRKIAGIVHGAREFTINGDPIFLDPTGRFEDTRLLLPGYNAVTIAARDRFGKGKSKTYEVIYNKL